MNEQPTEVSREQLLELLKKQHDYVFDPETAPVIQHRWVDRGLKYSCEDAGHAQHEVWKRRTPMQQ